MNAKRKRRTQREKVQDIDLCFKGEDIDKLLAGLNPCELKWFWEELAYLKRSAALRLMAEQNS